MFLSLVDWPLDDRRQLEEWVELELNGIPGQTAEQNQITQANAIAEISKYCMAQLALRRDEPREDMTTLLMNATVAGEPIPPNRLVGLLLLLMIAGLDTTQSVTSQGMAWLAADPSRQDRLREDPARLPAVIEELLRWNAPAGPNRSTVRDTELGGVAIRAGDRVHIATQAGNRDPDEFDQPDIVDFDREVNRHTAFGLGPHKCIGAAMARTVLAVAFDEFHKRIPRYEIVDMSSHLGGVWGMNEVVVHWDS
jgi:cytochrome P450